MSKSLSNLDAVGLKHGTDKASRSHDYLKVYDKYLRDIVSSGPGNLLELGWWTGASMRVWREWLPADWTVTGLDIEDKEPIDGVNFVHGDQTDTKLAAQAAAAHGPWDVIVDDASHLSPLTIASFRAYWPHLRRGGLYIIEDLQVSYHRDWLGNPDPDKPGPQGQTIMQFLKNLTDDVHYGHAGAGPARLRLAEDRVASVAFYPALCIIEKMQ